MAVLHACAISLSLYHLSAFLSSNWYRPHPPCSLYCAFACAFTICVWHFCQRSSQLHLHLSAVLMMLHRMHLVLAKPTLPPYTLYVPMCFFAPHSGQLTCLSTCFTILSSSTSSSSFLFQKSSSLCFSRSLEVQRTNRYLQSAFQAPFFILLVLYSPHCQDC